MSPNQFNQIDTIKEEFIQEWNDGQNPTLSAYLHRYPEFAEELTQFVMAFALLHAVPLEPTEPSEDARQAMLRGLSAGQAKTRTVAARLKEIGMTEAELAKRIRSPIELLGVFHSSLVEAVPQEFWKRLASALSLSQIQSRQMLAPRNLAFRRQKGAMPNPRTFADIVEELRQKELLSDEDYSFWKAEAEAK